MLGLEEALRVTMSDGTIGHAELTLGGQVVTIGLAGGERFGTVSSITLVFVKNVDATCERARAAGGSVIGGPQDHPWGLRQAVVADPEGQRWEVTQHLHDVAPTEWGAAIVGPMPSADG